MTRSTILTVILVAGLTFLGAANALADDCVPLGGAIVGGECQISASPNNHSGPFTLNETLHILTGGAITTGAGQIAGNSNTFQGARIESNAGNGVYVSGTGNTIKSNKANKNAGAGFKTAATATGTKFGSNASNETAPGGSKENGGPEYDFAIPAVNLGSNKADNLSIPTATKCLTLFSLGGVCE